MEVSGQLHAPAASTPEKEPPRYLPTGQEAMWAPEMVCKRGWGEKFPASAGTRSPRSSSPYPSAMPLSYPGSSSSPVSQHCLSNKNSFFTSVHEARLGFDFRHGLNGLYRKAMQSTMIRGALSSGWRWLECETDHLTMLKILEALQSSAMLSTGITQLLWFLHNTCQTNN
jgi:hypothetical protein